MIGKNSIRDCMSHCSIAPQQQTPCILTKVKANPIQFTNTRYWEKDRPNPLS